ncbi:MAG: hypothetical protein ACLFUJ_16320 [Phycisphaerae bacterium]
MKTILLLLDSLNRHMLLADKLTELLDRYDAPPCQFTRTGLGE